MELNRALEALKELETTLHAYRHAMGVLTYDGETVAPRNSAAGRGDTLALLSGVEHDLMTRPATKALLGELEAQKDALSHTDRRRVELLREESDDLTLVPAKEYMDYQSLLANAQAVWHDAKLSSDYAAFAPYLEKIIAYNRRFAERKNAQMKPYDALLDTYEKGARMETLDPFFRLLQTELTPLILEIGKRPAPDTSFLRQSFPIAQQRVFSERLMDIMGISRDDCAIGETEHPFTDGYNKHDVRITTHYFEGEVLSNMYSVIHEGGHALYELGSGDALEGTVLAGGATMGIHESQSRFYENIIGRSLPFCRAVLPVMQELFPAQLAGVTPEALYRAVNLAQPSLIRTEADELTYGLHVMVRYELEKGMISGELSVKDLPGEWNKRMKEALGVEVPDHRRGVLQDSHWSGGLVGYFPSYALGSAYGVQMLEQMQKTVDVWGSVERGDLRPVTEWLRERIHRHGCLLTPAELLQSAMQAPFDPSRYTEYLKKKFSALYAL